MKRIDVTISCCMDCPYYQETSYFFTCKKLNKNFTRISAFEDIREDCPLEEILIINKKEIIVNRFEILDL